MIFSQLDLVTQCDELASLLSTGFRLKFRDIAGLSKEDLKRKLKEQAVADDLSVALDVCDHLSPTSFDGLAELIVDFFARLPSSVDCDIMKGLFVLRAMDQVPVPVIELMRQHLDGCEKCQRRRDRFRAQLAKFIMEREVRGQSGQ